MTRKINNKENELIEQHSPLKNTDNAFVQVNRDGSPMVPVDKQQVSREHDEKKPVSPEDESLK